MVFGSGALVRSLLRDGLVDEMVLMIHPILLGSGIRLFAEKGDEPRGFDLVESVTTGNGVFIGTYALAKS
ncbi:dihydrofolate reductase family protein [Spirillospora sp. NPDC049652]